MAWRARPEVKSAGVQSEIDGALLDKATEMFEAQAEKRWQHFAAIVQTPKAGRNGLQLPFGSLSETGSADKEFGSVIGSLSGVTRLVEQRVSVVCQAQDTELQALRARVANLHEQVARRDRIIEELLRRGGWDDEVEKYQALANQGEFAEGDEEEEEDTSARASGSFAKVGSSSIHFEDAPRSGGPSESHSPDASPQDGVIKIRAPPIPEPEVYQLSDSFSPSESRSGSKALSRPPPPPLDSVGSLSDGHGKTSPMSSTTSPASSRDRTMQQGVGPVALPSLAPAWPYHRRKPGVHQPSASGTGPRSMALFIASQRCSPSGKAPRPAESPDPGEIPDPSMEAPPTLPLGGIASAPSGPAMRSSGSARGPRPPTERAPGGDVAGALHVEAITFSEDINPFRQRQGSGRTGRPSSAGAHASTVESLNFSLRISSGAGVKTVAVPMKENTCFRTTRGASKGRPAGGRSVTPRAVEVF